MFSPRQRQPYPPSQLGTLPDTPLLWQLKRGQSAPTAEFIELVVAHTAKTKGLRPVTHGVELKARRFATPEPYQQPQIR